VAYIDTLNADALGANLDHGNFNSTNVDIDSGAIDGVTIGGASAGAITGTTIDATTDFTIGSTVITDDSIVMTPTSSDTATIAASTNGALTITTVDTAAAAANLLFTIDGTAEIASQGLITLDSGAAINLEPAAGSAFLLDGTISIDAGVVTGATSITSTAFVGTVDGVVGGNTPAAGTFTNLQVTTDVNIDDSGGDGAMDGVIIGAAAAAAGTFTTLNTTGLTAIGDASGDTLTINAATINPANIAAGTDNTVVVYNGSTLLTDEIDSRVWGTTLVDTDGSGANNELATWSDADSLIGEGNLTFDGSTLVVTGDISSSAATTASFGRVVVSGSIETSASLFIAKDRAISFDNGDVTLTHSSNLLDIDGGNTRVC
jgi:hypothetical protein